MQGYVPGEQPRDRSYVKLNTNENPYPPSPRVIEALAAAAREDVRLYPDPIATELRATAAAVYGVAPEQILAGNGSDDLLAILFRACADPLGTPGASPYDARVAYPVPTYSLYDTLAALQGCAVARVPFPADFSLPREALVRADARLTIVCNPNAPTGTFAPIAEIEAMARGVRGVLVVDEAYVDFAPESALPLVREHENVVVLRTFSKSYSLAGMRIGLAFGSPRLVRELYKVKDSYNLSRANLAAAKAALEDQAWMRGNVAKVRAERSRVVASLRERGFVVPDSEANFVLARRPGEPLRETYLGLKGQGVLVRYFDVDGLRDSLRISVGTPDENTKLLAALDAILASGRSDAR